MPSHLFITGAPVSATRTSELAETGMRGLIALPVRDERPTPWLAGLRGFFPAVATRHRTTFIPLSTFAFQAD